MIHYLNIFRAISTLIKILGELNDFLFHFLPKIKFLEKTGELEKLQIRTDYIKQLGFVINMPTDILMMNSPENEIIEFERSVVKQSMEKRGYTAFFSRQNLLETLRIRTMKRIKDDTYYAYLIKMWYNFRHLNLGNLVYIIVTSFIYYVVITYLINADWVNNFISFLVQNFK